ncbi:MAG: hypothetical protein IKO15_06815 [Clostridiales bacterium]|nr:hypothetical protein [Clostridiales bacterium]
MALNIVIEILILWVVYTIYMGIVVFKCGPVGGLCFYPKVMQKRVIELGLISEKEFKARTTFALVLLVAWMLIIPMIMIVFVNGARSYWDCCWQFYALFLGAEFFDWLAIDTLWVAVSDWWLIPGTEDLDYTWHDIHVKQWKFVKLIPASVPLAAIAGGLYWLVGKAIGG